MKKYITILLLAMLSSTVVFEQDPAPPAPPAVSPAPPQGFSLKASISGNNGQPLVNKDIILRISIVQNSTTGSVVYSEIFNITTNSSSQVDIQIGTGTPLTGIFSAIPWSTDVFFLKIEVDTKLKGVYTLLATTQLLSVPYALYAAEAGTALNEYDPLFTASPANGINYGDISNWSTSFDWGNHAAEGYLKSFTEADPVFVASPAKNITTVNIENWNNKQDKLTEGTTPGEILYWNGSEWVTVAPGTNGANLSFCNGVPTWGGCVPQLTTELVSNFTATTAVSGGNISNDRGFAVTARGVCWGKASNPTISGNHTTDGSGTGSFISSMNGLVQNTLYFVRAYATNSAGTEYGNEVSFTTLSLPCGSSFTINHVTGNVAPVDKTVTYGTVTNIPGVPSKCWITSNLGADHQATSVNDATEASAGWYWQFNRKQGFKHDGTTSTPAAAWETAINENGNWLAANDPCSIELGGGWRIPTATEWSNFGSSLGWGYNPQVFWNSNLKLHEAGYVRGSGHTLYSRGGAGDYRASTQGNSNINGNILFFSLDGSGVLNYVPKVDGMSVRCIKD